MGEGEGGKFWKYCINSSKVTTVAEKRCASVQIIF